MTIRRASIRGFRAIEALDLELEPLTVFVGPNGAGKSSILEALARAARSDDEITRRDVRNRQGGPVTLELEGDDQGVRWTCSKVVGLHGRQINYPPPSGAQVVQTLRLDPEKVGDPQIVAESCSLKPSGEGLVNVFATLTRREQDDVAGRLAEFVPTLCNVNAKPHPQGGGRHRLVFQDRWVEGVWYEPNEVSEGTLLLLAYLLLPCQRPAPTLLTIEEPERGLHPYLLGALMSLLHDLAQGAGGKSPIQIVLATHSSQVVEFARPEEVRFVSRRAEDGAVQVKAAPVGQDGWQQLYETYQESLGQLWLSGSLGGVPGPTA